MLSQVDVHAIVSSARADLSAILRRTSQLMERVVEEEVADFHGHISVDMTLSPQDALAFVLGQLESLGLVDCDGTGVWNLHASSSGGTPELRHGYPDAVPARFEFASPSQSECEAPRKIRLQVSSEYGAGIHLRPSWYGMIVDEIEDLPGQAGLRLGDCIRQIQAPGQTWHPLYDVNDREDCELLFAQCFQDGANVLLEPHCETWGDLPGTDGLDLSSLRADLASFSVDFDVELQICRPARAIFFQLRQISVLLFG